MLNNVILVGRVVVEPELTIHESGVRSSRVLLSVLRPFRNEKNEYESDLIPIYVWYKMADLVCDYVGAGSIVGFKCRLGTHRFDVDNMRLNLIDVIAERISFIQLKERTNKKTHIETEEELIAKELQKCNFADIEYDELKGQSGSVVLDDNGDVFTDIVDEKEDVVNDENKTKTKKKAK